MLKQVMRLPGLDAAVSRMKRYRSVRRGPVSRSRLMMAFKAAVAGAAAWYVALVIPEASTYAYYAPFGAVMAMTFSIADSLRQVLRSFLAIAVGAGLAMVSGYIVPSAGAAVAIIIFIGIAVGGFGVFGSLSLWIPVTAIFVLIIGNGQPSLYVGAYVGLTMLGGAIAAIVNVAIPPLPIASFDQLQLRIRGRLADRMEELAEWVESAEDSARRAVMDHQILVPLLSEIWSATNRTADAQRVNLRARRYAQRVRRQYDDAYRLERLVYLAQETAQLVDQGMETDGDRFRVTDELRPKLTDALEAYATALRWAETSSHEQRQALASASRHLRELRDSVPDDDWLVISILASVRRSAQILVPDAYEPEPADDADEGETPDA